MLLIAGSLTIYSWIASRQARVYVEWSTASELDTAGFNLYRGVLLDQIDLKINPSLISSAEDPLQGGSYRFIDKQVVPGTKYYYLVEEVDQFGKINRFGPIEVIASGGGKIELGLALLFGLLGMVGLFLALYPPRHKGGAK